MHRTGHYRLARLLAGAAVAGLVAGCATGADKESPPDPAGSQAEVFVPPPSNPAAVFKPEPQPETKPDTVTLSQQIGTMQRTLRKIADVSTVNLVVMNGLEDLEVGPLKLRNAPAEDAVEAIAAAVQCAMYTGPHYSFIYPAGYEPLLETVVVGQIDPAQAEFQGDFAFGSGMFLFNVVLWIGEAMGTTVVVDNAVGQAESGELSLNQVPLDAALEAVLRSARVADVRVDSTDEYVFLYNAQNQNPASLLLNPDEVPQKMAGILEREVDVYLPKAPRANRPLEMLPEPTPLAEILPELSRQLGVPVVAEPGLEDIPINPVVFRGVRVKTAMDLLMRQWLLPHYGYQATQDRIVIRKRLPGEAVAG